MERSYKRDSNVGWLTHSRSVNMALLFENRAACPLLNCWEKIPHVDDLSVYFRRRFGPDQCVVGLPERACVPPCGTGDLVAG